MFPVGFNHGNRLIRFRTKQAHNLQSANRLADIISRFRRPNCTGPSQPAYSFVRFQSFRQQPAPSGWDGKRAVTSHLLKQIRIGRQLRTRQTLRNTALGAGARLDDTVGLLKFAFLCDVEMRWSTASVLIENPQAGGQTGIGDNWFGPQIRFYRQTAHVPTLAFSYAVKAPTASTMKGLGSGRVDHQFTFLASKDIHNVHFDFNSSYFLIGRPAGSGFDSLWQINLAFSHAIYGNLGFTGEFYGVTRLNAQNPAFASNLWALTYNILPRLVVDGGIDVGITHGAPQKRFFAGVTYSITNIYKDLKRH